MAKTCCWACLQLFQTFQGPFREFFFPSLSSPTWPMASWRHAVVLATPMPFAAVALEDKGVQTVEHLPLTLLPLFSSVNSGSRAFFFP